MDAVDLSKESMGPRIRRARQWIEMTQTELAAKLGLSASGISEIENAEREIRLEMLPKLVEATGQSLLYFLGLEPINEKPMGFERWPGGTSFNEGREKILVSMN